MYRPRIALCYTGGKDSTLALHLLLHRPDLLTSLLHVDHAPADSLARPPHTVRLPVAAPQSQSDLPYSLATLVTFAPPQPSFLSHPVPVIQAQARAMALPHVMAEVCGPDYAASYAACIARLNVDILVTGDMMDICGGFMTRAAAAARVPLWCPLWDIARGVVWDLVLDVFKMSVVITCVHTRKFYRTFAHQEKLARATAALLALPMAAQQGSGSGGSLGAEVEHDEALMMMMMDHDDHFVSLSPSLSPLRESSVASSGMDLEVAPSSSSSRKRQASPTLAGSPPPARRARKSAAAPAATTTLDDVDDLVAASSLAPSDADAQLAVARAHAHATVGRIADRALVRDWLDAAAVLDGVDVAGEMGEFHSMVVSAPLFVRGTVVLDLHGSSVDPSGEYVHVVVDDCRVVPM
ncbi:hypothetical protein BC828DRAFT_390022 [Blastocladiella britannica]|nr:hypothetical protein BC828DRAFT_390022 [Blastocladiella britannica]